jgi:hypothetical protein
MANMVFPTQKHVTLVATRDVVITLAPGERKVFDPRWELQVESVYSMDDGTGDVYFRVGGKEQYRTTVGMLFHEGKRPNAPAPLPAKFALTESDIMEIGREWGETLPLHPPHFASLPVDEKQPAVRIVIRCKVRL